ncbi:MAG: tetratricopeptide repeat protein [Archangium sp.]|nr:tetratricopeptide repeat protein [Archangium sp.]MDP3153349.1 tetratricopeptide repeat protein [Archangium sp.]MDP3573493.1 tetratricopeptide repeat protein [Archangium sp.]
MNRDAWKKAGEAHLAQGQLRRALGAFRRALEVDVRGEQSFELHQLASVTSQVLSQRGAFFLHPSDDTVRSRWLEGGAPPRAEPDFAALALNAEGELKTVLTERSLPAKFAGQLLAKDEDSRDAVLWLYERLLDSEEKELVTSG